MISRAELLVIMSHARDRVDTYLDALTDAMREFEIDNPKRIAAFLAQIAHESGELRYVEELASGEAYEARADLGNNQPGDGPRYKGRGLLQITGRANYADCSIALFGEESILLDGPARLTQPVEACRSAGWFWNSRKLNELADKEEFRTITRRINGGLNGYPQRWDYYIRARETLGIND